MKGFQLQGLGHHSSVVGAYALFLVANSVIGKADKMKEELKELRETVKFHTAEVKAAKIQALSAVTEADKALAKK
eukprot:13709913-Ditylum_brightwellii.AAC.1